MLVDDTLHVLAGRYVASPQWVKTLTGGAYAMVPPALRFGRHYQAFKTVFGAVELDQAYLRQRLCQTLDVALTHVEAFRDFRHLRQGLLDAPEEVLSQLPFTEKEAIKLGLERFTNSALPHSARLKMFTGGSTSVPMTFYAHRGVSRAKEWAAFHAMGDRFGTEGKGIVLALRGRTVRTAGSGRMWMYEPIKRHLILSTDHLEPEYMTEYVEALTRWKPRYIHAFPSALYPLIAWLSAHGKTEVLSQVTCVVLTSESVFEHHMTAFKAFFNCPVIVTYGHTERVLLGHTLADDPRYHMWPHYGHLELIDSRGKPVTTQGQVGEIVGTSFDNLVMPFVRYRTGDFAVLGGEPHPSLRGYPVLERIEGRLQEFVVCHDHRLVTVTTLGAAHFEQLNHCLRIQYEQFEPGEVLLKVVPLQRLSDSMCDEIAQAVRDKTQGGCDVRVIQVESIPVTERGKQRLLVQHLDIGRYLGAAMDTVVSFSPPAAVSAAEAPAWDEPSASIVPPVALEEGKQVLMLSTSPMTRGGIAAVVKTYRVGGLFEQLPMRHVSTHLDGSRGAKAVEFIGALGKTVVALARGKVALVHAHVSSAASFWRKSLLLALARCFGVPTIFHLHSGGFAEWVGPHGAGMGSRLRVWWIRHTLQSSTAVIVLTDTWGRWIHEFAPRAKVEVLGNPVELPIAPLIESQRGAPQGQGRVLFLGWIYDFKGCYDLLKAWVLFRQQCPGWRLVVGGKGEVDQFLAEAERLGVRSDLDFLGWVSGAEKEQELRRADIFVLPSYREGMPVSVLEAMAYGVPVICTPVGGVPDMMEPDVHGLWVEPGDVQGLSDRLVALATDMPRRATMAAQAREHVLGRSSVGSVIAQLQRIYTGVLKRPMSGERPRG